MESDQGCQNVFFVGIGGIGMSAIARWFNINGYQVGGYDRASTPLTQALEKEGMVITYEDRDVPPSGFSDPEKTLVVYTPAIPADHRMMRYFRAGGFKIQKRSQILGELAGKMTTVAVAGTHGKTTTSSLTAHLIRSAGVNCAAFLGGISNNYNSNFLLNQPAENLKEVVCIVEADEFDRSFLTLFPHVAVITSTDADHLDIYGDHQELLNSFQDFANQIDRDGTLFLKKGLGITGPERTFSYSLQGGDYYADHIRLEDARFVFDLHTPSGLINNIKLQTPGYHNIENAIAAAAAAMTVGVKPEQVRDGLNSFKGVKRRFEYIVEGDRIYIDDYAHHPAEITAFLKSLRGLYPTRKITAVFQPHLYTRTRDFADEFGQSLALADEVILLDIYPARELPIEGVDSKMLLKKIPMTQKKLMSKEDLIRFIGETPPELLATIGAGDIDKLVPVIKSILQPSYFP